LLRVVYPGCAVGPARDGGKCLQRTILHAHAPIENLGDRLIVQALRDTLRDRLRQHELVFVDALPVRAPGGLSLADLPDPEVERAVDAADLVVLGGGELIGPYRGYLGLAAIAAAAGVPVAWLGVGGRIEGGRVDRAYTRALLRRADVVVTRDPTSYAHLTGLVPPSRLRDGVDVAFGWHPPSAPAAASEAAFGICLRGPERASRPWDERTFEALAGEIEVLASKGLRPVFLTFLSERDARRIGSPNLPGSFSSDEAVHDFVLGRLRGVDAEVVHADGDLDAMAKRVAGLRFVIGMRLHALVLAAHCGVPFIALDYAPKVVEFATLAGASGFVVTPDEVGSKLPKLTAELATEALRNAESRRLASAMKRLAERAHGQLDPVAALLESPPPRAPRRLRRALTRAGLRLAELHARR